MMLVPADTPGITKLRAMQVYGEDDAPHGHMHIRFENVRVPVEPAGRRGQGLRDRAGAPRTRPHPPLHARHRPGGNGAGADVQARAAPRGLRQAAGHLGANYDIIAECRMEIEMARLLCLKAAWMMDQGDPKAAAPWISQIKVVAPRMALKVTDEAVQMFGAQGISQDTPLARLDPSAHLRSPTGRMPCTAARWRARNCASTPRRRCDMKAIVARDFAPLEALEYADWPEPKAGPGRGRDRGRGDRRELPRRPAGPGPLPDEARAALRAGHGNGRHGDAVGEGVTVQGWRPGRGADGTLGAYAEKMAAAGQTGLPAARWRAFEDACALMCGYGTSHYALKQRGQVKAGETLCVLGASGLTGIAAVQIGKAMGAKVIGVASSEEKRKIACKAGADVVLGYDNLKDDAEEGDRRQGRRRRLRSGRRRELSMRCRARWAGAAGCSSSASPPAPSRSCRSTSRW
jgi:hypothetical protein